MIEMGILLSVPCDFIGHRGKGSGHWVTSGINGLVKGRIWGMRSRRVCGFLQGSRNGKRNRGRQFGEAVSAGGWWREKMVVGPLRQL